MFFTEPVGKRPVLFYSRTGRDMIIANMKVRGGA